MTPLSRVLFLSLSRDGAAFKLSWMAKRTLLAGANFNVFLSKSEGECVEYDGRQSDCGMSRPPFWSSFELVMGKNDNRSRAKAMGSIPYSLRMRSIYSMTGLDQAITSKGLRRFSHFLPGT
jgi:hypothetical protein